MSLLNINDSVLIIIDIQEKLVASVEKNPITDNAVKLAKTANILEIPAIISEQYPKGLGETIPQIKSELPQNSKYFEKTAFSLFKEENFVNELENTKRKQIILCGIETHICVYQTAIELAEADYEVFIVKDACASRKTYDYETAIDDLKLHQNIKVLSLEMVLFELLRTSKHTHFKEIQALIK